MAKYTGKAMSIPHCNLNDVNLRPQWLPYAFKALRAPKSVHTNIKFIEPWTDNKTFIEKTDHTETDNEKHLWQWYKF